MSKRIKKASVQKGKVSAPKLSRETGRKKKIFLFIGFLFAGIFLVSCMFGQSSIYSNEIRLHRGDFKVSFRQGTSKDEYSDVQLKKSKDIFVRALNNLPVKEVRNNLISLIISGKLKVKYSNEGLLSFWGPSNELSFNPKLFLLNENRQGYLGSYLIHENHHMQDWLGNNPDGLMYYRCERNNYLSKECILEWWDAEWRAVKEQAEFLRKYDCTDEMTTGPKVNNRAIFEKYDPNHSALIYLWRNYYDDPDIFPALKDVFPEYYRNKLKEIN